jgi:acetyl/propionyl-CoA carboxylase alpha subunit
MVEKLIERPRHIEVQFLADKHGNVACLFERECSLQRRHQKLVEEAPSAALSEEAWQRLRQAVESLVHAAENYGAGTAEFMFDEAAHEIYFLEVNARLQVEHPVTEAITGVDLVRQQLLIADGHPIEAATRDRSAINGHSIEVRVVAEDPARGFLPSIGRILAWAEPRGPGIRVDTGFGPGGEISRFYDSMIAKVIVHAETRELAIRKLEQALLDFHILGVKTNIPYTLDIIRHPEFVSGEFDTGWLGRAFPDWTLSDEIPAELGAILAQATPAPEEQSVSKMGGVWDLVDGFRVAEA